jgi:hypothetical protein
VWFDLGNEEVGEKPKTEEKDKESDLINDGGEGNEVIDNECARNEDCKGDEAGENRILGFDGFGKAW